MLNAGFLFFLVLLASVRESRGQCLITLVSGAADADTISVVFRNNAKLPIRRMEFNCTLADARAAKTPPTRCYEPNVSFLPRMEYTVNYAYPAGKRGPMLVSLKTVTFADGSTWKPSKKTACRSLKIALPHASQRAGKSNPH